MFLGNAGRVVPEEPRYVWLVYHDVRTTRKSPSHRFPSQAERLFPEQHLAPGTFVPLAVTRRNKKTKSLSFFFFSEAPVKNSDLKGKGPKKGIARFVVICAKRMVYWGFKTRGIAPIAFSKIVLDILRK